VTAGFFNAAAAFFLANANSLRSSMVVAAGAKAPERVDLQKVESRRRPQI
jgi:hypothetical protein